MSESSETQVEAAAAATPDLAAENTALKAKFDALVAKVGDGTNIPDWMQRRLDSLTARLRAEEETTSKLRTDIAALTNRLTAAQAELAQARGAPAANPAVVAPAGGGPVVGVPTTPPADFQTAVQQEAERLRREETEQAEENASLSRGEAAYPDFKSSMQRFGQLGPLPPTFIQAAMATGAAEHVLYKLANNLNEASRIANLDPIKMAVEMSKLTEPPPPPPKVPEASGSNAPPPIKPVKGGAAGDDRLRSDLSMAEWIKRREAQKGRKRA